MRKGISDIARDKADRFLPEYSKYGRSAPLRRNGTIIENFDIVLTFRDGSSRGTKFVIDKCRAMGVRVEIFERYTTR